MKIDDLLASGIDINHAPTFEYFESVSIHVAEEALKTIKEVAYESKSV